MTAKTQTNISVSFLLEWSVILFKFFNGYKRFCNIALNCELLLKKRFPFYIL